jgi:hypothetical protein
MQPALKAQINKTDRNDARGIVRMMRAGLCRPVHVKTLRSQKLQMLLTHRKLRSRMSALGQKQTFAASRCGEMSLFNHLVGAGKKCGRNVEVK